VRERRNRKRRLCFGLGLAISLALFVGGLAFASAPIIGNASNQFTAPTYTIDQGEVAQLQVTGSSHNATAHQNGPDGKALFRSPTISGGNAGVNGTQYLSTGDYTFFCTVHPSTMQATLHVSGNGAPQARPSATLAVRSKKISKVTKKGLLVAVNASAKVDSASLTAKLGKTTIGQSSGLAFAAGQVFETVRLSKAGKAKLSKKNKATVTVTADIPFGSPATAKKKLT
jgi:plastocyanin